MSSYLNKAHLLLIFSLSFFILSAAPKAVPPKSTEQYWKETGLSIDHWRQFFSDERCKSTKDNFVSCMTVLNKTLQSVEPLSKLEVRTPNLKAEESQFFGPVAISNVPKLRYAHKFLGSGNLSPKKKWETYQFETALEKSQWANLFDNGTSNEVPIDEIASRIQQSLSFHKDRSIIMATAINKFLSNTKDPHTHIAPTQQLLDRIHSSQNKLIGIGIIVKERASELVIADVIAGSPAQKANLKVGDIIVTLNRISVQGQSLPELQKHLVGPLNSKLTVNFLRNGVPQEVHLIRQIIKNYNVRYSVLEHTLGSIGYLRLHTFASQNACKEVEKGLQSLQARGVKSLIFDLRDNGGGLVNQADCIAGLFVGEKLIHSELDLETNEMVPFRSNQSAVTNLPMITLINARSASASELVAGALQDHERSWIAGDRSYGKGTVQVEGRFVLDDDLEVKGVSLLFTVKKFFQPSGRTNQRVGISPELPLVPVQNPTDDDRFSLREENLYTNALAPEGPVWKIHNPQKVATLRKCLQEELRSPTILPSNTAIFGESDFEIRQALLLAGCQLKLGR